MSLAPVYGRYPLRFSRGEGAYLWDQSGKQYLDFYSGHGVISIGHSHPHFVENLKRQLDSLSYYSNAVHIPEQEELDHKLAQISGYPEYQLFLCNSGAEAVENCLKIASFSTGRRRVIAFKGAFHGRTSLAVQCSDNDSLRAPINHDADVCFLDMNDGEALEAAMADDIAAVIIEGIQGVGGIMIPDPSFLDQIRRLCDHYGAKLIIDEVQSGVGRSGRFFAHQRSSVKADLIAMAKGLGNGYPIGAVLISPDIALQKGQLGTTFGGHPLACVAAMSVLDVLVEEALMQRATDLGNRLKFHLTQTEGLYNVRGEGLMLGFDIAGDSAPLRKQLLLQHGIFTGSSSRPTTVRLLPPLIINEQDVANFMEGLQIALPSHLQDQSS